LLVLLFAGAAPPNNPPACEPPLEALFPPNPPNKLILSLPCSSQLSCPFRVLCTGCTNRNPVPQQTNTLSSPLASSSKQAAYSSKSAYPSMCIQQDSGQSSPSVADATKTRSSARLRGCISAYGRRSLRQDLWCRLSAFGFRSRGLGRGSPWPAGMEGGISKVMWRDDVNRYC